jgi:hypothetical protein
VVIRSPTATAPCDVKCRALGGRVEEMNGDVSVRAAKVMRADASLTTAHTPCSPHSHPASGPFTASTSPSGSYSLSLPPLSRRQSPTRCENIPFTRPLLLSCRFARRGHAKRVGACLDQGVGGDSAALVLVQFGGGVTQAGRRVPTGAWARVSPLQRAWRNSTWPSARASPWRGCAT